MSNHSTRVRGIDCIPELGKVDVESSGAELGGSAKAWTTIGIQTWQANWRLGINDY